MDNLAITYTSADDHWRAPDWQQLWLAVRADPARRWRSLAVVPAGPGMPVDMVKWIAVNLAHTGMVHVRAPIHVADATALSLDQVAPFSKAVFEHAQRNELVIVALSSLADNVVTKAMAKLVDAALLAVLMGGMRPNDARKTVGEIGSSRFLGSAAFRIGNP